MSRPRRNRIDTGQARRRIDAGLTGDKVAVSDPAAVPQQTDAEAAGAPTPGDMANRDVAAQERMAADFGHQARPLTQPLPDTIANIKGRDLFAVRLLWMLLALAVLVALLTLLLV